MTFSFDNNIILEDSLLLIKPITLADKQNLLPAAQSSPDLLKYSPKQVSSSSLLDIYVDTAIRLRANNERYTFTVYDKQSACYLGSTAFMSVSTEDSRIEIGATWLGKNHQGIGLNIRCKNLMLAYMFDVLQANRVEFRTDERNTQSRRAITKIGGQFEGILREHMLLSDGYLRNTVYYSILKSEWEFNRLKQN